MRIKKKQPFKAPRGDDEPSNSATQIIATLTCSPAKRRRVEDSEEEVELIAPNPLSLPLPPSIHTTTTRQSARLFALKPAVSPSTQLDILTNAATFVTAQSEYPDKEQTVTASPHYTIPPGDMTRINHLLKTIHRSVATREGTAAVALTKAAQAEDAVDSLDTTIKLQNAKIAELEKDITQLREEASGNRSALEKVIKSSTKAINMLSSRVKSLEGILAAMYRPYQLSMYYTPISTARYPVTSSPTPQPTSEIPPTLPSAETVIATPSPRI